MLQEDPEAWHLDVTESSSEEPKSPFVKPQSHISVERRDDGWQAALSTSITFVTFSIFIVSLAIGVVFYSTFHGWELSTAFYYASQVLLGNMYNIPVELDSYSEAFTMVYFLWGTGLIACCHLIATNFTNSQSVEDPSGKMSGEVSAPEWLVNSLRSVGLLRLLRNRGYFRIRIFCISLAAIWVFLGTIYGLYVENWSFLHSIYFAFGAMSAAGVPAPPCLNGDDLYPDATCQLGTMRGIALGIYLIVGVPLFAFTIGLMAGYVVDYYATLDHIRVHSSTHLYKLTAIPSPKAIDTRNSRAGLLCCSKRINVSNETESDLILGELLRRGRICGAEVAEIRKSLCCCYSCTMGKCGKDGSDFGNSTETASRRWFQMKRFVVPIIGGIIALIVFIANGGMQPVIPLGGMTASRLNTTAESSWGGAVLEVKEIIALDN